MTRVLSVGCVFVLVACGSSSESSDAANGGNSGTSGSSGNAGGGGSGASGEGGAGASAATLRFTGTASAEVDESASGELPEIDRVECNFYGEVLELVDDESGGWSGVAIGEVFRNLYSGEQRFEFSALIGGPATLTAAGDDLVELRAFGDQTGAKPFWLELEVLRAGATSVNAYEGSWTCASLDLAEPGFPDVGYEAPGTWELELVP